MKILVTGGTGFLGSWLVKSLLAHGHQVSVLTRNKKASLPNGAIAHFGHIEDVTSLKMATINQDAVFHLAGYISYQKSERSLMEKINVQGTKNIAQACVDQQVQRLIHMSSVVAVGAGFSKDQILNEQSKYNLSYLDMGYFETKREAEKVVLDFVYQKDLDAVILNPSTIYGPGDAEKGSRKTQLKVAQGRFPFYTGGGVSIVSVEEVVQACITSLKKGRKGERYILSGDNILIYDLFRLIATEAGTATPKWKIPRALLIAMGSYGDVKAKFGFQSSLSIENAWSSTLYHWFDHSKSKSELDFHPRPAVEAIAASVKWMKETGLLK